MCNRRRCIWVQVKAAKDDVAKEKAAEKEAARKRELVSREQQRAGAGPSGVELDSLISQGRNPELFKFSSTGRPSVCRLPFVNIKTEVQSQQYTVRRPVIRKVSSSSKPSE